MSPLSESAAIIHARSYDPGRGPFDPRRLDPLVDREKNPRGVRHLNKTAQDNQPAKERERVREASRQSTLRRQGK